MDHKQAHNLKGVVAFVPHDVREDLKHLAAIHRMPHHHYFSKALTDLVAENRPVIDLHKHHRFEELAMLANPHYRRPDYAEPNI